MTYNVFGGTLDLAQLQLRTPNDNIQLLMAGNTDSVFVKFIDNVGRCDICDNDCHVLNCMW